MFIVRSDGCNVRDFEFEDALLHVKRLGMLTKRV
jgi:hypothetical protein